MSEHSALWRDDRRVVGISVAASLCEARVCALLAQSISRRPLATASSSYGEQGDGYNALRDGGLALKTPDHFQPGATPQVHDSDNTKALKARFIAASPGPTLKTKQ